MATAPAIASGTSKTTLDSLAGNITAAVISTHTTGASSKFLPNGKLRGILNHETLTKLFAELCAQRTVGHHQNDVTNPRSDSVVEHQNPQDFASRILLEPSRLSLLALLIYDRRMPTLNRLLDWLSAPKEAVFPSDDDLPFDRAQAEQVIHENDVEYVLDHQAMFTPFIICEHDYRTLDSKRSRPPFIGERTKLGEGSSGAVYKITIAAGHYLFKRHSRYIFEDNDYTVALKVFHATQHISAESAAEDYKVEREFLEQLKMNTKLHKMILLDLGGIVEMDGDQVQRQSLLFELALCDLDKFFKSKYYKSKYAERGSVLIRKAMDLLDALKFLHQTFKSLHLDIKPDNILVFDDPEHPGDVNWKLSDFSLSRKKLVRCPNANGSYEISNIASNISTVPSARSAGIYQAPEIQVRGKSPASEGSDVWSMGCLVITLLAFIRPLDGIQQVHKLDEMLDVYSNNIPTARRLFYVTDTMLQWQDPPRSARKLGITTKKGSTGSQEAALHPRLIEWMDYLYFSSHTVTEQEGFALAAKIILESVLVIDRRQRITASEFYKKLQDVHDIYESLNATQAQPRNTQHLSAAKAPTVHSRLCEAIRHSRVDMIIDLANSRELSSQPCPRRGCGEYPLHQILRKEDRPALDEILESLGVEDVKQYSMITRQTPLSIACEGDGDEEALQLLYNHFGEDIMISGDFYRSIHPKGKAAKILKKWYRESERRLSRGGTGTTTDTPRSSESIFSTLSRRLAGSS